MATNLIIIILLFVCGTLSDSGIKGIYIYLKVIYLHHFFLLLLFETNSKNCVAVWYKLGEILFCIYMSSQRNFFLFLHK